MEIVDYCEVVEPSGLGSCTSWRTGWLDKPREWKRDENIRGRGDRNSLGEREKKRESLQKKEREKNIGQYIHSFVEGYVSCIVHCLVDIFPDQCGFVLFLYVGRKPPHIVICGRNTKTRVRLRERVFRNLKPAWR